MTEYTPQHEDNVHPEAVVIIAFSDVVGIACDDECAQPAIDDITADHGEEAEAGHEPANQSQIKQHRFCMNCGQKVES